MDIAANLVSQGGPGHAHGHKFVTLIAFSTSSLILFDAANCVGHERCHERRLHVPYRLQGLVCRTHQILSISFNDKH